MHVCIFQEPVEYASQSTYITLFQKHCDCFTETKTTVFDLLMRVMRLLSRPQDLSRGSGSHQLGLLEVSSTPVYG